MPPRAITPSSSLQAHPGKQRQSLPGALLPGITLAAAVAILALTAGEQLATLAPGFPVSPIMLAILLGMLISNIAPLNDAFKPGLQFCLSRILQLGIILLGIRLSLAEFAVIGISTIPLIAVCITSAVFVVRLAGKRLGLSPQLSTLIAIGTSICGATAIVTAAPIIRARPYEVTYAIACITLFGMLAVLAYPLLAHGLFAGDANRIGLFLGTAIHDTAQVMGAGLVYQSYYGAEQAMDTATVTKLVRNLAMLIVIPALSIMFRRSELDGDNKNHRRPHWLKLIPLFIVGFACMSLLRTLGDLGNRPFGILTTAEWANLVGHMKQGAEFCLLIAMAAVGLNSNFTGMQGVGLKPLGIGLLAATLVGAISCTLILLFY